MSNNFIGTIIEESLASKDTLEKIKITEKKSKKLLKNTKLHGWRNGRFLELKLALIKQQK